MTTPIDMTAPLRPDPRKRARYAELRRAAPDAPRDSLVAQVEREFAPPPSGPATLPSVAADATRVAPAQLPQILPPPESTVRAQAPTNTPDAVPINAPGPVRAAIRSATNLFGLGDEFSAFLNASNRPGQSYEELRRRAELETQFGQARYPKTTAVASIAGGLLPAVIAPELLGVEGLSATPSAMVRGGTLGNLARNVGEGMVLGAVSGAGNASPGHRVLGAIEGAGTSGLFSGVLGTAGAAVGGRMGSRSGRTIRDIAESGDTDIEQAAVRLAQADPESPLVAADLLGPTAAQRLRGIRDITGPGQRRVVEGLESRMAGRPMRVQSTFEDALGTSGLNPVQAAKDLRAARGAQAEELYGLAYKEAPSPEAVEVARIPLVKDAVDRLRSMRRNAGESVPRGRATVEELHTVRMILDKQSQALDNPSAASADKAPALVARGLRDRVDAALKTSPAFRRADEAFDEGSRFMERYDAGTRALQTDPSELEYLWQNSTPDERQLIRLGLPASTLKAIEGGSVRGVLGRIGLGPTGRLGRGRVLEDVLPPSVGARVHRVAGDEELMARTEQAGLSGSPTSTNQEGIRDALASGSLRGALRKRLVQSVMGTPSPEALGEQAEALMASGPTLRDLLSEAVTANRKRAGVRSTVRRGNRLSALLLPTFGDEPE